MKKAKRPIPRPDVWLRSRERGRVDIHNRAVQGLFIANGGGAVALLTAISRLASEHPDIARVMSIGLGLFVLGLILALPLNFLRYESSRAHDDWSTKAIGLKYSQWWKILSGLSITMFVAGGLATTVLIWLHLWSES
jgi:hypothetical protein